MMHGNELIRSGDDRVYNSERRRIIDAVASSLNLNDWVHPYKKVEDRMRQRIDKYTGRKGSRNATDLSFSSSRQQEMQYAVQPDVK